MVCFTVEVVAKRPIFNFYEVDSDGDDDADQGAEVARAKTEPSCGSHVKNSSHSTLLRVPGFRPSLRHLGARRTVTKWADVTDDETPCASRAAPSSQVALPRLLGSFGRQPVSMKEKTEQSNALQKVGCAEDSVKASEQDVVAAPECGHDVVADEDVVKPSESDRQGREDKRTTIMLRNLPNDYDREMFLELLDTHGLRGKYDFVYFPADFKTGAGLGYAFVNMVSHAEAEAVWQVLSGFKRWRVLSSKQCEVCWSGPYQGLKANVNRYRGSPVMHHQVPEIFKPVIFTDGVRTPFPAPKKPIKCKPVKK